MLTGNNGVVTMHTQIDQDEAILTTDQEDQDKALLDEESKTPFIKQSHQQANHPAWLNYVIIASVIATILVAIDFFYFN